MGELNLIPPVCVAELMSEEDVHVRYQKAKEVFDVRRTALPNAVRCVLEERDLRQIDLSRSLHLDVAVMNRAIRPRAEKFEFPPARLSEFARQGLGLSGHELLFGERLPTRLPRYLSVIVEGLLRDQEKQAKAMSCVIGDLWQSDNERTWREEYYSELNDKKYSPEELLADRITEVSEGMYVTPTLMFGMSVPYGFRNALRVAVETKDRMLRTNTLMFLAMCLHTTVDYFLAVDYTMYTDVCLYNLDKDGQPIIVKDPMVLLFLSHYLRLSKEGQEKVYSQLLQILWKL